MPVSPLLLRASDLSSADANGKLAQVAFVWNIASTSAKDGSLIVSPAISTIALTSGGLFSFTQDYFDPSLLPPGTVTVIIAQCIAEENVVLRRSLGSSRALNSGGVAVACLLLSSPFFLSNSPFNAPAPILLAKRKRCASFTSVPPTFHVDVLLTRACPKCDARNLLHRLLLDGCAGMYSNGNGNTAAVQDPAAAEAAAWNYIFFGATKANPLKYDCAKWVTYYSPTGTSAAPGGAGNTATGTAALLGLCKAVVSELNSVAQIESVQPNYDPNGTMIQLAFKYTITGQSKSLLSNR